MGSENNCHKFARRVKRTLLGILVVAYALLISSVVVNAKNYSHEHPMLLGHASERVLICLSENAYAYHSHYCRGLNNCKERVRNVSVAEAERLGYRPCKICY